LINDTVIFSLSGNCLKKLKIIEIKKWELESNFESSKIFKESFENVLPNLKFS
jgi:hypothetical protein